MKRLAELRDLSEARMLSNPSFLDRALKRAVPRPVTDYSPPPRELCPGIWALDRRLRHFGLALLPSRTTVIGLDAGRLAVVSPPSLADPATAAAIDAIGKVSYVIVPNPFHYLYASAFLDRYPQARLLVAPGTVDRTPELDSATELGPRPPEAWPDGLEYALIGPANGPSEVMLFHVRSKTLVLTDLAFNMNQYPRRIDRAIWRLSGIPAGFGPGRTSRSLLLRDRDTAARALSRALEWPIDRIVVAHGDVVDVDAEARLRSAFSGYLP